MRFRVFGAFGWTLCAHGPHSRSMGISLPALRDRFELSLHAENKAPRTVDTYPIALDGFAAFLPKAQREDDGQIGRDDVRFWVEAMQAKAQVLPQSL
jgi:hypothetical protein